MALLLRMGRLKRQRGADQNSQAENRQKAHGREINPAHGVLKVKSA
jgi:hypothetical protein